MWSPFVPFDHLLSALSNGTGSTPVKLRRLKQCILNGMIRAAKHRIRQKVDSEGWAGGISFQWLEKLAEIKRAWCNGICKFTILRWALNQDDDVWLSVRGTRHNQPCQQCRLPTDIYPNGFWQFPQCESCIQRQNITPYSLYPDVDALLDPYQPEERNSGTISNYSRHNTW